MTIHSYCPWLDQVVATNDEKRSKLVNRNGIFHYDVKQYGYIFFYIYIL